MSTKEVTELRKAGQLQEAYDLAQSELQTTPDDIWAKRAMSWVLYDCQKEAIEDHDTHRFLELLDEINKLHLPEEEQMFWEKVPWNIGKLLYQTEKQGLLSNDQLNTLFGQIRQMPLAPQNEGYSFMLKAFLRAGKDWPKMTELLDWWDLQNLMEEDMKSETLPNGKRSMSLGERAYLAYAKALLEENPMEALFPEAVEQKKARIESFMPLLDQVIENHPEYQYPPYYKGKLLLAQGDKDSSREQFLPFARKKHRDFWVWTLMADMFPGDDERHIACICRALLCGAEEKFLGKTRLRLVQFLVNRSAFDLARAEIDQVVRAYEKEEWRVPKDVLHWQETSWYANTQAATDEQRRAFYLNYRDTAEEVLFGDVPERIVVVDFVNTDKKILYFVGEGPVNGHLKYGKLIKKVAIGDTLKVRLDGDPRNGFYKAFTLRRVSVDTAGPNLRRPFAGTIVIKPGATFGFVDDVFVSPDLVNGKRLQDGQMVEGKAILSWNKSREEFGWKAVEVNRL